jgi:hypothetical protein
LKPCGQGRKAKKQWKTDKKSSIERRIEEEITHRKPKFFLRAGVHVDVNVEEEIV